MTKKKWIVLLTLITCGIIAFLFLRFWTGHTHVASGKVAYTYNCGWLDWKHASPGGIKDFVDDFDKKFIETSLNETFKITYGQYGGFQQMGYPIFSYSISKEYEVLKLKEDERTKNKMMFHIFKEVSYLFENQQKEVFWGILKSSAFREGDLMGNLVGFYIAIGEISQAEAAELCEELSISISLQLKKEGKFQENDSLIPNYRIILDDKTPIFPAQLTKYNNLESIESYITPLEKTETTTILGNNITQK